MQIQKNSPVQTPKKSKNNNTTCCLEVQFQQDERSALGDKYLGNAIGMYVEEEDGSRDENPRLSFWCGWQGAQFIFHLLPNL